jgi:hydrogenase maturation protease
MNPLRGDCVVIGLGSPYLRDDAVGPRVVRELAASGAGALRLVEAHAGGLLLLEELAGAACAIIVDALLDPQRAAGEVVVAGVLTSTRNASCGHDCSLPQALAIGRAMGLPLPSDDDIHFVAVVAEDVATFDLNLSASVAAALPAACRAVRALARRFEEDGRREARMKLEEAR